MKRIALVFAVVCLCLTSFAEAGRGFLAGYCFETEITPSSLISCWSLPPAQCVSVDMSLKQCACPYTYELIKVGESMEDDREFTYYVCYKR